MNHTVKEVAKKGAKLWVAKKGLGLTGSLFKWGLIAGAGYLAYTFFRDHKDEIKEELDGITSDF